VSVAAGEARTFPAQRAGSSLVAVDVADQAGIYEVTETSGAVVEDFNRDGRIDILLSRHEKAPARLYLGDGDGHFFEAVPGTFVQSDRHGCAAGDVNADGLLDAYCTTGGKQGVAIHANQMWLQRQRLRFVDRAVQFGGLDPYGRGRRAAFIDVDHDPFPDLFVGNDPDRVDGMPSPNRLLMNVGGTSFRPAPEMGLDGEVGAACVQVADIDGDGWDDLMVCGGDAGLFLYRNGGGIGFSDIARSMGLRDTDELKSAVLVDLDADADQDLVQVTSDEVRAFHQRNGTFRQVYSRSLIEGNDVAAGDASGDGFPDLYVVQGDTDPNQPDAMLINDGTGAGFAEMDIPQTDEGGGEAAYPIDHDGNGLSDFLVLNGAREPGPVQLIAFFSELGPQAASGLGQHRLSDSTDARPDRLAAEGSLSTLTERWDGSSWEIVESPNVGQGKNTLFDVGASSPKDVWAVGAYYQSSTAHTLTERWDGSNWTVVSSPNVGGSHNFLFDVTVLAPEAAWAVGSARLEGIDRTLIQRWDGAGWSVSPSPNVGDSHNTLHSITASSEDDMWAVGRFSEGEVARTLALRFDGATWAVVPSPNLGQGNPNALLGVSATPSGEVWAVGFYRSLDVYRPLAMRWRNGRWRILPAPMADGADHVLLAVSATSSSNVWAAGYRVEGSTHRTYLIHWDGSAWTMFDTPAESAAEVLRSVEAISATEAWAVGTRFDSAAGTYLTHVLRWNGSSWNPVESPSIVGEENELLGFSLTGAGGEAWAVGASFFIEPGAG
jgi:hypothetical protein